MPIKLIKFIFLYSFLYSCSNKLSSNKINKISDGNIFVIPLSRNVIDAAETHYVSEALKDTLSRSRQTVKLFSPKSANFNEAKNEVVLFKKSILANSIDTANNKSKENQKKSFFILLINENSVSDMFAQTNRGAATFQKTLKYYVQIFENDSETPIWKSSFVQEYIFNRNDPPENLIAQSIIREIVSLVK